MKVVLGLLMVAATSLARPEVGIEKKFKSSREINAQQLAPFLDSSQLPSVANTNPDVPALMFLPEYNAYLVPAETLYPNENENTKRRRPMVNLIKLLQQRRVHAQQVNRNVSDTGNITEATINRRPIRPIKPNGKEDERSNISSDESVEKYDNKVTQPVIQNEPLQDKGHAFGQVGQLFQRPENPAFPNWPQRPQFQLNRPLIASYLPAGLAGWRPFGNLFQQQYSETPREIYVQYLTKTAPPQQTYYYDQYTPRVPQVASYADDVQQFVSQIQDSVIKETALDGDTSMMVATLPVGKNTPTSLVLRPVAKAVAGAKGVAVASPIARAVLKKGENVNIDFDPDAVAIAGPGGQAHAHPRLVISYSNDTSIE